MNYEDHGQCLPTSVRGARGACGRGARATQPGVPAAE